jgi:magnesium chelatase subunit I
VLPGLTGKLELVFEGEQEGAVKVGRALVAKAVRSTFNMYFPDPLRKRQRKQPGRETSERELDNPEYAGIIRWFESGHKVELSDEMPTREYMKELEKVPALRGLVSKHMPHLKDEREFASAMEFVLDGLHQSSRIAKDEVDHQTSYQDLVGTILAGRVGEEED